MKREPPKVIEHDMDVITTHGTFKRRDLQHVRIEQNAAAGTDAKSCPLRGGKPCDTRCTLWNGRECKLHGGGSLQAGGVCPISGDACGESCAMYQNAQKCDLF